MLYVEERIGEKKKSRSQKESEKVREEVKLWQRGNGSVSGARFRSKTKMTCLSFHPQQNTQDRNNMIVFIFPSKFLFVYCQQNPQIFRFSLIIAHHYFLLCRVFLSVTSSLPMRWRREQGEQVA